MTDAVLGIDVSKKTLNTSIRVGGKLHSRRFANSPDGWRQLICWLSEQKIRRLHACLEATGRYSLGVALALHQAGYVVSIVNPVQIRDFARIKLGRNKVSMLHTSAIMLNCSSRCPGPRPRRRCGGWRATNDPCRPRHQPCSRRTATAAAFDQPPSNKLVAHERILT